MGRAQQAGPQGRAVRETHQPRLLMVIESTPPRQFMILHDAVRFRRREPPKNRRILVPRRTCRSPSCDLRPEIAARNLGHRFGSEHQPQILDIGTSQPYIMAMTKLLDEAVEVVRRLPSDEQDDIARAIMQLAGADLAAPVVLSPEER